MNWRKDYRYGSEQYEYEHRDNFPDSSQDTFFHVCKSITMKSQQRIFFDFLRFCIGVVEEIPESVKDSDWSILYGFAKKQALIGVLFHGLQQLPKEFAPHEDLLMSWMGMAQRIKQQNMRLFMDSAKICKIFKDAGFRNCVLKGQGNALLYPDPYMRTPGDIDHLPQWWQKTHYGVCRHGLSESSDALSSCGFPCDEDSD